MVLFITEIVVLQQLKLLYARAGTLLHGFLEALYCGAAVIEVAIIYAYYIGLRTLFFRGKTCVQYSFVV